MADSIPARAAHQIDCLRRSFAQADALPFAALLAADDLATALGPPDDAEPIYSLPVTLWLFLSQVVDADHSCRQAVGRLLAWRAATGQPACSANNGAYCKARQRLAEAPLERLVQQTGDRLHRAAAPAWRWRDRPVKIADGTTVTLPDTPANQAAYPQPDGQQPGLGFPMLRLVVLFCLATGAVLAAACCPYCGKDTGELALFRQLWHHLTTGDLLLADRLFCSYFEIALLQQRGVDVVLRKHQSRPTDFRTGQRLGPRDHLVHWTKPGTRPAWLDRAAYAALPARLTLREVAVTVTQPGFRTRQLVVVTTLLDAGAAPRAELGDLYRQRWHAELDLRALKQAMQLGELRCRTPAMARKELWVHLLAYNLLRGLLAQAAAEHERLPRQLSLTGALQTLHAFAPHLLAAAEPQTLLPELWAALASHRVGDRPDRVEPRARKRRCAKYPVLTQPRAQARALLGA